MNLLKKIKIKMFGTKILEERHSKYNKDIKIVKSLGLGTYIQVNGLTQSGGIVESIWKSTFKKINNKDIKNCLILGLGGGTVAKLIRKKYPKAKIAGIEIDPLMVQLGNVYLELKKSKVDIKIQDAFKLTKGIFDLIIVDIYCGNKYPKKFENEKFLDNIKKILSNNGLVVFNRLFYKDNKKDALNFERKLKQNFKKVDFFYPLSNLMFICRK
jgi:spermidine synthase